jgi:macrodomain Ter protein organizer (MatP/YcbG family)
MKPETIVEILNAKFKGQYIFEKTDEEDNIVGFVDDETFKNIIAVFEPTEQEMSKVISHIEDHTANV